MHGQTHKLYMAQIIQNFSLVLFRITCKSKKNQVCIMKKLLLSNSKILTIKQNSITKIVLMLVFSFKVFRSELNWRFLGFFIALLALQSQLLNKQKTNI